jgi:hypothetical protein
LSSPFQPAMVRAESTSEPAVHEINFVARVWSVQWSFGLSATAKARPRERCRRVPGEVEAPALRFA